MGTLKVGLLILPLFLTLVSLWALLQMAVALSLVFHSSPVLTRTTQAQHPGS